MFFALQRTGERPLVSPKGSDLEASAARLFKPEIAAARIVMHAMKRMLTHYCTDMYGVLETPPTLTLGAMVMVSESML